jgi:hypothetical protein
MGSVTRAPPGSDCSRRAPTAVKRLEPWPAAAAQAGQPAGASPQGHAQHEDHGRVVNPHHQGDGDTQGPVEGAVQPDVLDVEAKHLLGHLPQEPGGHAGPQDDGPGGSDAGHEAVQHGEQHRVQADGQAQPGPAQERGDQEPAPQPEDGRPGQDEGRGHRHAHEEEQGEHDHHHQVEEGPVEEPPPLHPQHPVQDVARGGEELGGEYDQEQRPHQAGDPASRHHPQQGLAHLRVVDGQDDGQPVQNRFQGRLVGQEEATPGHQEQDERHQAHHHEERQPGGQEEAVPVVEQRQRPHQAGGHGTPGQWRRRGLAPAPGLPR